MKKLLLIWSFFFLTEAFSYSPFRSEFLANEATLQETNFYLVTMGPSDELYTQGGHSLLRVQNTAKKWDFVFNWGTFDPDEPYFIWKFYKGDLPYTMSFGDAYPHFMFENRHNPRDIDQDEINLTLNQKAELLKILNWWAAPENSSYVYHIWADNCSTKIRDVLNTVLGDDLKAQFAQSPYHTNLRPLWRGSFFRFPLVNLGGDLLLNAEADRAPSYYDAMFIPQLMREFLLTAKNPKSDGAPLLSSPQKLFQRNSPLPSPLTSGQNMWLGYLVFVVFLSTLGWFMGGGRGGRLIGLSSVIYGGCSFVLSSIIIFTSLLTTRTYFHWGAYLWFFWPLDLVWFVSGTKQLFGFRPLRGRWVGGLVLAHLCSVFALGFLTLVGLQSQELSLTAGVLLIFFYALAFKQAKPME